MTISEILEKITILEDCTTFTPLARLMIITGIIIAVGFGALLICDGFYKWFSTKASVTVACMSAFGFVTFVIGVIGCMQPQRPQIDYYVSINDVEISEIVEYFDVKELSQVNDMTVCHIVPKKEYYDEVLEIRTTDNLT